MQNTVLKVSEFVDYLNQTLDYAYPEVVIEGEVSGFNVNQNKYVFFNIKDEEASLPCFIMVFNLKTPLEDGMKVRIRAKPELRKNGRFSLSIREVLPVGEGSLKRAYELLKAKLEKEGLFAQERKRPLPKWPTKIGLISSESAAGFGDFIKIVNKLWRGVEIIFLPVQVQGEGAAEQIANAIEHFNQMPELVDVLAVVRGGGSLEDLQPFNTELVARAIASSRVPTIVGVGHEQDITLADLSADVRAATPTDAARIIVPDKREVSQWLDFAQSHLKQIITSKTESIIAIKQDQLLSLIRDIFSEQSNRLLTLERTLRAYNPRDVLNRGYAIVRHEQKIVSSGRLLNAGDKISIELIDAEIDAEVEDVRHKG